MTNDTSLSMEVTLTQAELRMIIAKHISKELGENFYVHPSTVVFELTDEYEDRPCGEKTTVFHQAVAKAVKTTKPVKRPNPWDHPG